MYYLTVDQLTIVLQRLDTLVNKVIDKINLRTNSFPIEYISLMSCFLLHNLSSAKTLLRIFESFGTDWFPVTVGYTITRPMFEIDVTAHYISQSPLVRSQQYIDFKYVLDFKKMQNVKKHRASSHITWKEAMNLYWNDVYDQNEQKIISKFEDVRSRFTYHSTKSKNKLFKNWAGISLKEIALAVNHEEAYDVFYGDLSSFTHADVSLADRFLKSDDLGLKWSVQAEEGEVGCVIRYAVTFLDCFLRLFGKQFSTWQESEVDLCWQF